MKCQVIPKINLQSYPDNKNPLYVKQVAQLIAPSCPISLQKVCIIPTDPFQ